MKAFHPLSAAEQLANHLREEIQSGALDAAMPGVGQLVKNLGVGTKTVVAAMEILKKEGLIATPGIRMKHKIVANESTKKTGLQIRLLLYEESDMHDEHTVQLYHRLEERGHPIIATPKTMTNMKFDLERMVDMIQKNPGDAWIVRAGSRPLLEWFALQTLPVFAWFGRQDQLPIAGLATRVSPAMIEALQLMVKLGHRRIVMLVREERRKPTLATMERNFLQELKRLGIEVGAYNLPDWENDPVSFHACLESLFRHTPPTAMFLDESALFFATLQFLASKNLSAPRDVSLAVFGEHPAFEWLKPEVSRITTDTSPLVSRVVNWAENVANGREDRQEMTILSKFIKGGTIGRMRDEG